MTVLILAGSGEARHIAQYCADHNITALASLAGLTRLPIRLALPTRCGGFGGADGFRSYVKKHDISAIVDATHPYATNITRRSFMIAQEMDVPFLRFERPQWEPIEGDHWVNLADESEAQNFIKKGETVFLATGRQSLQKFANLSHARLFCRQIDPPVTKFPWPNGEYIVSSPPFSIVSEVALFSRLEVDILVVKNAGGFASRTKLDAARILGISVLMIARPSRSGALSVQTLPEVEEWLDKWKP